MGPKKKKKNGNSYEYSVNIWVEKYRKKKKIHQVIETEKEGGDIVLDCVVKKSFRKVGAFELWSKWQKGASHVKSLSNDINSRLPIPKLEYLGIFEEQKEDPWGW